MITKQHVVSTTASYGQKISCRRSLVQQTGIGGIKDMAYCQVNPLLAQRKWLDDMESTSE